MVADANIVNYVNKDNLEQALEALETIYNRIENKPPNLLPKIAKLPYPTSLMENFIIKTNNNIYNNNLEKPPCKICDKEVDIQYMRSHVAKHILKNETSGQVCGILHSGNVQKSSTRNKASKAIVDCQYYHNFSYKSVFKLTKSNPSSNRPENCTRCNSCVWSYNFVLHYQERHHGVVCPILITEEECEAVKQYKI